MNVISQQDVERRDTVSLGCHFSRAFLQHFGLLCPDGDPFSVRARAQIKAHREVEGKKDSTSRSVFHRAQCVWRLGMKGDPDGSLADGLFESGEPVAGKGPEQFGLTVCHLRHPREGDAEISALCSALSTSMLQCGQGRKPPAGLELSLHLSDVPCISCLGATLQFHFRFPGVLRVSFDRGRELHEDTVAGPRPPPRPSKKAPQSDSSSYRGGPSNFEDNAEVSVDRSMVRRDGPDCREVTSFYACASRRKSQHEGAASGGSCEVPHRMRSTSAGGPKHQTFYFSLRPEFYGTDEYGDCPG